MKEKCEIPCEKMYINTKQLHSLKRQVSVSLPLEGYMKLFKCPLNPLEP